MKQLITTINEKPYHVRRRWLIALTTITTLLVVTLWVITLKSSLSPIEPPPATEQASASTLQTVGEKVKAAWGALQEGISGTVTEFKQLASSTPLQSAPQSVLSGAGPSPKP